MSSAITPYGSSDFRASYTPQELDYLNLILEDLQDHGLGNLTPLREYLTENFFQPLTNQLALHVMSHLKASSKDPQTTAILKALPNELKLLKSEFYSLLDQFASQKSWNDPTNIDALVLMTYLFNRLRSVNSTAYSSAQQSGRIDNPVMNRLEHLFIERIVEIQPPVDPRYFWMPVPLAASKESLLFWLENGAWSVQLQKQLGNGSKAQTFLMPLNAYRTAIFDKQGCLIEDPVINLTFAFDRRDPFTEQALMESRYNSKPIPNEFRDRLNLGVFFSYYMKSPDERGDPNSVGLAGRMIGSNVQVFTKPSKEDLPLLISQFDLDQAYLFALSSVETLKETALLELSEVISFSTRIEYTIVLPTNQDVQGLAYEQATLELLEEALQEPQSNDLFIEWLASQEIPIVQASSPLAIQDSSDEPIHSIQILIDQKKAKIETILKRLEVDSDDEKSSNNRAPTLSEEELKQKQLEKLQRAKDYKQKTHFAKKKEKAQTLEVPARDPRPISEQLKPKMRAKLQSILSGDGRVNYNKYRKLLKEVLKTRFREDLKSNTRGSHENFRAPGTGMTLVREHGGRQLPPSIQKKMLQKALKDKPN